MAAVFQSSNMDKKYSGYAPGKIILAGEHAVVYGRPSIAAAIDRGIRIDIVAKNGVEKGPVLYAPFLQQEVISLTTQNPSTLSLVKVLEKLFELYGAIVNDLEFQIDSTLKIGRGLGSSAALSVALVRSICLYLGSRLEAGKIESDALELERIFHSNPSGIDHTAVNRNGIIYFQRSVMPAGPDLRQDDNIARSFGIHNDASLRWHDNVVETIRCPIPLHFVVASASPHGNTKSMVQKLRDQIQKNPRFYESIFDNMGLLAQNMCKALQAGNLEQIGELMDNNQGFLNALGVSSLDLERACFIARQNGALGAKLTGAGGGGCIIALVEDPKTKLVSVLQDSGFDSFLISLNV